MYFTSTHTVVLIFISVFAVAVNGSSRGDGIGSNSQRTMSAKRKVKREHSNAYYGYGTSGYHDNIYDAHFPRLQGKAEMFVQTQPILNFPIGTELKLVPSIEVPILSFGTFEGDFNTKVKTEFPLSFVFKNKTKPLPADFLDDPYLVLPKFDYANGQTVIERQPKDSVNEILSRKSRDLHGNYTRSPKSSLFMGSSHSEGGLPSAFYFFDKCPLQSLTDRRNILHKIEVLVKPFIGENSSKSCLLRWSCELHANANIIARYGLLGETALLIFKIKQLAEDCSKTSSQMKYLLPFVKAEVAGKTNKCNLYEKTCSKSIFTR